MSRGAQQCELLGPSAIVNLTGQWPSWLLLEPSTESWLW